jgi:hypothetical protein
VLFASGRARFRAVMLWVLAIVSTALVIVVGSALADASVDDQVIGMAASRAVLFVPVLLPINLWIISRVTGFRIGMLGRSGVVPVVAGLAAFGVERLLGLSDAVRSLSPLPELAVLASASGATAVAVLMALEPRVREQARELASMLQPRGRALPPQSPPAAER